MSVDPGRSSSPLALAGPDHAPGIRRTTLRIAERMLGLTALERIRQELTHRGGGTITPEAVLDRLRVRTIISDRDVRRVPRTGGLLAVASHPFGGLDALVLHALLRSVRSDVRVLANALVFRIPELRSNLIPVDIFGGREAAVQNSRALRQAIEWLRVGGSLLIFPAGEVAHLRWRSFRVEESAWPEIVARLALRAGAAVLPLHVAGRNSAVFQCAGLIHAGLRTALLPRELLNKRGRCVRVRVGNIVSPRRTQLFRDAATLTRYLRDRTLALADATIEKGDDATPTGNRARATPAEALIEPPVPREALCEEIERLPSTALLVQCGNAQTFCCDAATIPATLREIGRLRELTFRAVGEGTGKPTDLDRFDPSYRHLFVWRRDLGEIVGAYRLGLVDEIAPRFGPGGLYTHTLFRYGRRLLDEFGPAIELGRSFVVAEHQRSYSALQMLWKGIGRFVVNRPRYRVLFGAVSISAEYESMTKALLMAFLRANHFAAELARLTRPRRPPHVRGRQRSAASAFSRVATTLDDVDEIVRELEADGRGMPVLLRQYLKLNGRLLGFNVDPEFGNCIDGLFFVDLTTVNRAILNRFMGTAGADAFLEHHLQTNQICALTSS